MMNQFICHVKSPCQVMLLRSISYQFYDGGSKYCAALPQPEQYTDASHPCVLPMLYTMFCHMAPDANCVSYPSALERSPCPTLISSQPTDACTAIPMANTPYSTCDVCSDLTSRIREEKARVHCNMTEGTVRVWQT